MYPLRTNLHTLLTLSALCLLDRLNSGNMQARLFSHDALLTYEPVPA